jgi:signal transduction histidine kinase
MNFQQPLNKIIAQFLLLVLVFFNHYPLFATDTLRVDGQSSYPVANYIQWFSTPNSITASVALSKFESGFTNDLNNKSSLNVGFSTHDFWISFVIKNPSTATENLVLQFNNPYLNHLDIYEIDDNHKLMHSLHTGTSLPFVSRKYAYHDFVFPLHVPKMSSKRILIRASNKDEIFSIKPQLMGESHFHQKEQKLYLIIGLIIGIMTFNVLVNLFLGISLKDRIHFLYAFYVLGAIFWVLSSVGLDFQYLYPNKPYLTTIAQPFFGGITMVLMAQLSIVFLQLKTSRGLVLYFLNVIKWGVIVGLPGWLIIILGIPVPQWFKLILTYINVSAIGLIAACMIWAAIMRIRQGFKPAWFYLAAMAVLAISIFITSTAIIQSNDISPLVSPPTNIQIGILIETIFIFLGILYRYNLIKKQRAILEAELIQTRMETIQNVIQAQEDERKRLAQDLHDDLGGTLGSLILHVSNTPKIETWSIETIQAFADKSVYISKKALADLRNISHDLLPKSFETKRLFVSLNEKIEELNDLNKTTRFELIAEGTDRFLSDFMAITIYRMINELLTNIIKHSNASNAVVQLYINQDTVNIVVEDNGTGISTELNKEGIGLKSIKSRIEYLKGDLQIDSNNRGLTVVIDIPLNPNENDAKHY